MVRRVIAVLAVLILAAGGAIAHRTYLWSQAVTSNQAEQLKLLRSSVATTSEAMSALQGTASLRAEDAQPSSEVEAYARTQSGRMHRVPVGGFSVWSMAYEIRPPEQSGIDFRKAQSPPTGWEPDLSVELDDALPFPWPEKVPHPFHPNAMYHNARQLCGHYTSQADDRALVMARQLYSCFLEYVDEVDGAMFVLYRYDRHYRGVPVAGPWTTAYGSGAALIALTVLDACLAIKGARESADAIVAGMERAIDPRIDRPERWVSFVDEAGFLWFEEMPLDQVEQPRILNGHIRAITGLYAYWSHYRTEQSARLLQAGITTVSRYVPQYRVPGEVNRYDLMGEVVVDYGPQRTIAQQDQLYKISGDPIFAFYRDVFEADMRDDINAAASE